MRIASVAVMIGLYRCELRIWSQGMQTGVNEFAVCRAIVCKDAASSLSSKVMPHDQSSEKRRIMCNARKDLLSTDAHPLCYSVLHEACVHKVLPVRCPVMTNSVTSQRVTSAN